MRSDTTELSTSSRAFSYNFPARSEKPIWNGQKNCLNFEEVKSCQDEVGMRSKPRFFPTIFLQRPFLGVILGSFLPVYSWILSMQIGILKPANCWYHLVFEDQLGWADTPCQGRQSVGKDEVPSSNLGSSSKKTVTPLGWLSFLLSCIRFESSIEVPGGDFSEPVQKPVSSLDNESG